MFGGSPKLLITDRGGNQFNTAPVSLEARVLPDDTRATPIRMRTSGTAYSDAPAVVGYFSSATPQLYLERPAQGVQLVFTVLSGVERLGTATTEPFDVAVGRCAAMRLVTPLRGALHGEVSPLPSPPPPSRTDWTRRVPPPVLTGHASSLLPY